jgi:signal transduction histidine kinase
MSTASSVKTDIPEFLTGGGEVGQLIRAFDWTTTSLGPVSGWPQSLRTCVKVMLSSRQPYWIGWGSDLIKLYNDAYRVVVGGKHPWALGKPASVVWSEIWHEIEPLLTKAIVLNEGSYVESRLLIMERNGYPEETYHTFSYTPVAGDDGVIGGMICSTTDDSEKIFIERQLRTFNDLGKAFNEAKSTGEVYAGTISSLSKNSRDFPFTIFYELEGANARLVSHSENGHINFPTSFGLDKSNRVAIEILAALRERHPRLISELDEYGELPKGPWHIASKQIIVLPVAQRGQTDAYGFLLIGKNPFRLFDEKYCNFFEQIANQLAAGLTEVHKLWEERKKPDDHKHGSMNGVVRDLTLEKMAKQELERLVGLRTKELNEINDELYRSNEDLRQFAYIASHDLQEPLRKIQTFSDLAKSSLSDLAKASLYLDKIDRSASRMSSLIKDVLTYSQANKRDAPECVDVNQIIENVRSDFELVIEEKNAAIRADYIPPIKGSRLQIHQVFSNLISNAMKFSDNAPLIDIRYSVVDSPATDLTTPQYHLISVSDNGIGFEPEYAEKIFDLFSRLHNRKDYDGTGIGLALCKKIIENHGGMISAESEKDRGSIFKIYFPIK